MGAMVFGGWSTLNYGGCPPFAFCFLKGWAILLFAEVASGGHRFGTTKVVP
jgi:hypothetical protein